MTTEAKRPRRRPEAQRFLIPPKPPKYRNAVVRLDQLPPDELLQGEPPDADIVESLRMLGFVDPITVREVSRSRAGGSDYAVDDGGRRIKSARKIVRELEASGEPIPEYLVEIPARVILDMGDVGGAALALQKHATRRRNKVGEYLRVKQLQNAGADEATIARETRLGRGQIRELLRLDSLRPDLLAAAGESRISWGQAHEVAKLSTPAQERLASVLDETGRIKVQDIARERSVRVETASDQMDWGALTGTPDDTGEANHKAARDAQNGATIIGGLVLQAIGDLRSSHPSITAEVEVDVPYEGVVYTLTVRVGDQTDDMLRLRTALDSKIARRGDSGANGVAPSEATLEADEADSGSAPSEDAALTRFVADFRLLAAQGGVSEAQQNRIVAQILDRGASRNGRTRPARIKPCPHGANQEWCPDYACDRRRKNRERMRVNRGIS